MTELKDTILIEKRLELLREFHKALDRWFHGAFDPEGEASLRSYINRNVVAVRNAIREAGTLKLVTVAPPTAVGGVIMNNVNPFDNLFESFYGLSLISAATDSIEEAIGFMNTYKPTTDSLRSFRRKPLI